VCGAYGACTGPGAGPWRGSERRSGAHAPPSRAEAQTRAGGRRPARAPRPRTGKRACARRTRGRGNRPHAHAHAHPVRARAQAAYGWQKRRPQQPAGRSKAQPSTSARCAAAPHAAGSAQRAEAEAASSGLPAPQAEPYAHAGPLSAVPVRSPPSLPANTAWPGPRNRAHTRVAPPTPPSPAPSPAPSPTLPPLCPALISPPNLTFPLLHPLATPPFRFLDPSPPPAHPVPRLPPVPVPSDPGGSRPASESSRPRRRRRGSMEPGRRGGGGRRRGSARLGWGGLRSYQMVPSNFCHDMATRLPAAGARCRL
jgi:hypothetical protein